MFKLPDPSGPLTSNFTAVQRCHIYRGRPREKKFRPSTLPTPGETTLRMELALLKAKVSRVAWLEAQIARLEG